jgi:hypothetical protein
MIDDRKKEELKKEGSAPEASFALENQPSFLS